MPSEDNQDSRDKAEQVKEIYGVYHADQCLQLGVQQKTFARSELFRF
jgi:hypothetical protein